MQGQYTTEEAIDVVINGLRTLKLSQVRAQLEDDIENNQDRFASITSFVIEARKK